MMRRHGYPVAPMVVGSILGPMAEEQLRKAMAISQGDASYLVQSPFAIATYSALALIVLLGLWLKRRQRRLESLAIDPLTTPLTVAALQAEEARERP